MATPSSPEVTISLHPIGGGPSHGKNSAHWRSARLLFPSFAPFLVATLLARARFANRILRSQ
eukprot:5034678-Prymnesium_polylepis.1